MCVRVCECMCAHTRASLGMTTCMCAQVYEACRFMLNKDSNVEAIDSWS